MSEAAASGVQIRARVGPPLSLDQLVRLARLRFMSDYDERRQQRREEEHRYQMDAMYEVWRAGGNTDRIDYDRVSNHRDNGDSYETAARDELRRQRPKPQEDEQCEQQWPPEEWPPEQPDVTAQPNSY